MEDLVRKLRRSLGRTPARRVIVELRHRGIDSQDVFLASYPKSGNTWLKFMLAELLTGGEVDFDSSVDLVPMVGNHAQAPRIVPGGGRLVKTHEAYRREYRRGVYIVRDVRDLAISAYHFMRKRKHFDGSLDEFVAAFSSDRVFPYGSWHEHVSGWLDAAESNSGIMVVRYEDLRADPVAGLQSVLDHLSLEIESSLVERVVANNDISRMQNKEDKATDTMFRGNRSDIRFVRKGAVGGWTNDLTDAQVLTILADAGPILRRSGYDERG